MVRSCCDGGQLGGCGTAGDEWFNFAKFLSNAEAVLGLAGTFFQGDIVVLPPDLAIADVTQEADAVAAPERTMRDLHENPTRPKAVRHICDKGQQRPVLKALDVNLQGVDAVEFGRPDDAGERRDRELQRHGSR